MKDQGGGGGRSGIVTLTPPSAGPLKTGDLNEDPRYFLLFQEFMLRVRGFPFLLSFCFSLH